MSHSKVVFVCKYISFYGGNFIPSLLSLDDALTKSGASCTYVFPKEAEDRVWFQYLIQNNKDVLTLDFNIHITGFLKSLNSVMCNIKATIVHTHFVKASIADFLAIVNPNIKVIAHLHSDFSAGKKTSMNRRIIDRLQYKLFAYRTTFISVSETFVNQNPKRIIHLPNALALNRIPCKKRTREEIRFTYGIQQDDKVIEVFGWSPYVKGVDVAVETVKRLCTKGHKSYKLAIITGREYTEEKMRKWINENTSCNGDEEFLVFWPPSEDVFGYHKTADVLLSSSRSEGFSYSILEMLSIGKPCVVSDIPGVKWSKKFKGTSFFDLDDIDACADCVKEKFETNPLSHLDDDINKVKEEYGIEEWIESIMKIYAS